MSYMSRTILMSAGFAMLVSLAAREAGAALIDNTTQGNWIQGGNHVYGDDGYILMSFNSIVTGNYATSGNSDGALSDRVSLPSYVTSYSYNATGGNGWYGNNGPGNLDNFNPLAGLQDPLDPDNPAAAKQVGAYVYIDSPGTANIQLNLGANVPSSFELGLYGSSVGRPGQVIDFTVSGETAIMGGDDYTDGIWAIFTITGALPNSTITIDAVPEGIYGFISAITFDSDQIDVVGDYNKNGAVDAADYVVWRKFENTNNPLPNDNGLGTPIVSAHYDLWRTNFGEPGGSGAGGLSLVVPEPSAMLLTLIATVALINVRRKLK